MTEERQPDEVLRIIARPELDQYHDYAVHELWLGSFEITSGGKAHCAACAVELNRELSKHSEQQLAEARAQGLREAVQILDCFMTRSDLWKLGELREAIEKRAAEVKP